jgi:hypothetical protein
MRRIYADRTAAELPARHAVAVAFSHRLPTLNEQVQIIPAGSDTPVLGRVVAVDASVRTYDVELVAK